MLAEYGKYADGMLGKWGSKKDGSPAPGIKTLTKPLLGLLHGERGTKVWKQAMDRLMLQVKNRPDMTVSQLIEAPPYSSPFPRPHTTLRHREHTCKGFHCGEVASSFSPWRL